MPFTVNGLNWMLWTKTDERIYFLATLYSCPVLIAFKLTSHSIKAVQQQNLMSLKFEAYVLEHRIFTITLNYWRNWRQLKIGSWWQIFFWFSHTQSKLLFQTPVELPTYTYIFKLTDFLTDIHIFAPAPKYKKLWRNCFKLEPNLALWHLSTVAPKKQSHTSIFSTFVYTG